MSMNTTAELSVSSQSQPPKPLSGLWGDASSYTVRTCLAQVLSAAGTLVAAGFLGPFSLGQWNLVLLAVTYLSFLQLGFSDAVSREIPFWNAKGAAGKAGVLQKLARTYALLVCVASLPVIMVLAAAGKAGTLLNPGTAGLVFLILYFPMQQILNTYIIFFRAHKKFLPLSHGTLFFSLLNFLILPAATWAGGLSGFLAAYFLNSAALLAWYRRACRSEPWAGFELGWDHAEFKKVFAVGLGMFMGAGTFIVLTSLDRLFASSLGIEALGYYALAATFHNYIFQLPNALSVVTFPHFQEGYAGDGSVGERTMAVLSSALDSLAFLVLPVVVGTCFIAVPFLIRWLMPQFAPSILPLKLLLGGTFFLSLVPTLGQFLVTVNRQWLGFALGLAHLGVHGFLCWAALKSGAGLAALSAAVAVGYLVLVLMLTAAVSWTLGKASPGAGRRLLAPLLAGGYTMTLLWLLELLVPAGTSWTSDIPPTALRVLLFLAGCLPLFLHADRQWGLGERVRNRIGKALMAGEAV